MAIMELNSENIKIRTSYFSHYKGADGVCIAIGAPWWKGERYPKLYPPQKLLEWWKNVGEKVGNVDAYKNCYKVFVLDNLNVHEVAKELNGKVLLCFEKSDAFCHRHIVAEWFKSNGYECEEI